MAIGDPALDDSGRVLKRPEWYSRDEMQRALDTILELQIELRTVRAEHRDVLAERFNPMALIDQIIQVQVQAPKPVFMVRKRFHPLLRLLIGVNR